VFHWVDLRTFCYATEERERVEQALRFASGGDIRSTTAESHYGNPLLLLGSRLDTAEAIVACWNRIVTRDVAAVWREHLEDRVDDSNVFHARLDKQEAYRERIVPATSADVIDLTAKVRAYPAKRETALALLREDLDRRCN